MPQADALIAMQGNGPALSPTAPVSGGQHIHVQLLLTRDGQSVKVLLVTGRLESDDQVSGMTAGDAFFALH